MVNQISIIFMMIVAGIELIDGKPTLQITESIAVRQFLKSILIQVTITHRFSGAFCLMITFLLGIPISEALEKQKH